MNCLGNLCSCHSKDPLTTPKSVTILDVDEGQPCMKCTNENCPGYSQHSWRNICVHCKCQRNGHEVIQIDSVVDVRDRLGWNAPKDPWLQPNKDKAAKLGYSWTPAGLSKPKVEEYMKQLDTDKRPKPPAKYRDRQLAVQLPPQDLSAKFCRFLSDKEQQDAFDLFCRTRDAEAMDVGYVASGGVKEPSKCKGCDEKIEIGELAVQAPRVGTSTVLWHPGCFVCSKCRELLVDLCYCLKDGSIFCERHFAELVVSRCAACDELIFCKDFTKAMSRDWHPGHFACFKCDKELIGSRYLLQSGNPYCVECYENLFASTCASCSQVIAVRDKELTHEEMHWHEKCFHCCDCEKSLVDQEFATNEDKLFCSDCHDAKFAPRCDHCKEVFKGGMKKLEYNGRKWHTECFRCDDCHQPIEGKSFVPQDEKAICVACFENNYAPRCAKCNGPIAKSGITFKEQPWHKDCFTCSHCTKILSGEKFTTHDEKPYCGDCYGLLFAKKCQECSKPITGLGTTRFVSHEDKHWHTDCFVCRLCRVSLVGKGFTFNDEGATLCAQCDEHE